ncbi:MAG: sulfurtransferase TusA family protein [Beijerinckiaceae bacterium]|jgi:tRNA 2-thiouridine synthesizing protein A|nr:sulfurtransferase TusA family protein [Beijerinckiaceae bacterium]
MSLAKSPATPLPDAALTDDAVLLLDLSGLKCPLPALRTRKALKALASGARLSVISTDPMAAIDIPHLLNETGDALTGQHEADGKLVFDIRKT